MRYALLLAILAVTAHGARLDVVWPVADGHDSYRIERIESNGVRPAGALYLGRSVPRVYTTVESTITNEITGEIETTTNSVPVAHDLCRWPVDAPLPAARTEAEIEAYEAYVAAQAQAAQAALLQAIVDAAGDQIKTLEGIIDWFIVQGAPLTRPLSKDDVIGDVYAWLLAQPDAVLRDAGNSHATAMLALFSGLLDAGLDEATINAVWKYMIATGQN